MLNENINRSLGWLGVTLKKFPYRWKVIDELRLVVDELQREYDKEGSFLPEVCQKLTGLEVMKPLTVSVGTTAYIDQRTPVHIDLSKGTTPIEVPVEVSPALNVYAGFDFETADNFVVHLFITEYGYGHLNILTPNNSMVGFGADTLGSWTALDADGSSEDWADPVLAQLRFSDDQLNLLRVNKINSSLNDFDDTEFVKEINDYPVEYVNEVLQNFNTSLTCSSRIDPANVVNHYKAFLLERLRQNNPVD